MKRTLFLAVVTLASLLAPVGAAHAQVVKKVTALPARVAAPRALSSVKRLARINTALAKLGIKRLPSLKVFLGIRVTPVAPQWAANAKITSLGPGYFKDADHEAPHGSILLVRSDVKMTFPTEVGKLYVLDCRLHPMFDGTQLVTVGRPGATDVPLPVEDGHLLHVFQATETQSNVEFEIFPQGDFWASAYFYGCEFGKAN